MVDTRWAIYITPVMVVVFILLGYVADGTAGLQRNYNLAASNVIPILVLWIVGIILVWKLWSAPARRPVRVRTR